MSFIEVWAGLAGTYWEVGVAIVCVNYNRNRHPKAGKKNQNGDHYSFFKLSDS